ncbi:MAG: hypothetical protein PVI23_00160 [Maricaulaceae bacterium]|jgi:hypothetical protein
MRRALVSVIAASAACVGAAGQGLTAEPQVFADRDATFVQVVARAVIDFLPETEDADWALGWSAVGVRAQRMRWHLAAPDPVREAGFADARIRRTGWIPAWGSNASVVVCGNAEQVLAVRLEMAADFDVLTEALAAEGATLDEHVLPEPELPFEAPGYDTDVFERARWSLMVADRTPAILQATMTCTPEGARSAQRCSAAYQLILDAEASPAADGPSNRTCE